MAAVTLALWPALLLASGAATLAQQVAQPAPGGIVRDGPPPDLALMYTGDVIGFLDPCG